MNSFLNLKIKSLEYREINFLNVFRKLGFCKMNKLTYSSSNNENHNDDMWKEIKQRLENGASIRNIAFEYNNYYNVNKLKI
jgi:hypothetical protein